MFYIIRVILSVIFLFLISLLIHYIYRKTHRNNIEKSKHKIILLLVNSIVLCIVFGLLTHVPFENYIFSFSTVDSSFKYSYSTNQIYTVIESEKCDFIVFNQGTTCVNKTEDNRYRVIPRNNKTNKTLFIGFIEENKNETGNYSFVGTTLYNADTNQTYIQISKAFIIEDTLKEVITDSLGNTYQLYEITTSGLKTYHYYTVINSNISENYCIYMNGNQHNMIR